jgi:hypothetical protein
MAAAPTFTVGPRALLAGDGGLLMAAACAVLAPLAFLNEGATVPLMGVGLLAPMLAWMLHGRLVDGTATLGAVLGVVAGAAIAVALLLLSALVGEITNAPVVGQMAGVAVVAAYLAVVAWLDVDALRDLSPKRREHSWLDVARLVATMAIVAYLVGVYAWATASPEHDYVGAILSLMGCGIVGAAVVTVSDLTVRRHERRSHGHLISGV